MLYDSLHKKLMTLPDDVLVYPAHGAGSLCGRNMRAERSSTIGTERLTNYALQIKSREEFVQQLTSNLPARPEYFLQDAEINRTGASALSDLPALRASRARRSEDHAGRRRSRARRSSGRTIRRGARAGLDQHRVVGTVRFLGGNGAGLGGAPVLIAESTKQQLEARMRLARVGIEDARVFWREAWRPGKQAGFPLAAIPQITVRPQRTIASEGLQVLDVRREPEWEAGHIAGATWWPLDNFKVAPPEIDEAPIAVHCKGGYRSMIACSLLQRAGLQNVVNVAEVSTLGSRGNYQ